MYSENEPFTDDFLVPEIEVCNFCGADFDCCKCLEESPLTDKEKLEMLMDAAYEVVNSRGQRVKLNEAVESLMVVLEKLEN